MQTQLTNTLAIKLRSLVMELHKDVPDRRVVRALATDDEVEQWIATSS